MQNWTECLINREASIIDAVKKLDYAGLQVVLVVDRGRLEGIVTDGDIRRGIIRGVDFNNAVETIMNRNPKVVYEGESEYVIRRVMKDSILHQIPVVDRNRVVKDLISFNDVIRGVKIDTPVVLMVGGLGTRLKELTVDCPKPLINIGSKPILQTIIEGFAEQGFYNFILSVNYKSDMIEDYFGDGAEYGVRINYLKENKRMGTAGSLSMLPPWISYPIIVMNGDILAKIDYKKLLQYHEDNNADATMVVRDYINQVPFGVIRIQDNDSVIRDILEKPEENYIVNGGIYVLGTRTKDIIPKDDYYDMTQLFYDLMGAGGKAVAYKTSDYWIDVGRTEDLNKARLEFRQYF